MEKKRDLFTLLGICEWSVEYSETRRVSLEPRPISKTRTGLEDIM